MKHHFTVQVICLHFVLTMGTACFLTAGIFYPENIMQQIYTIYLDVYALKRNHHAITIVLNVIVVPFHGLNGDFCVCFSPKWYREENRKSHSKAKVNGLQLQRPSKLHVQSFYTFIRDFVYFIRYIFFSLSTQFFSFSLYRLLRFMSLIHSIFRLLFFFCFYFICFFSDSSTLHKLICLGSPFLPA